MQLSSGIVDLNVSVQYLLLRWLASMAHGPVVFNVCLLIRYNLLLAKVWVLYLNMNPSSPRFDL